MSRITKNHLIFILIYISINSHGQTSIKDTLYFKVTRNYLFRIPKAGKNTFFIKDHNKDSELSLRIIKTYKNLKPKKIYSLKRYIRKNGYYQKKRRKRKFRAYQLFKHFGKHVVILKEGCNFYLVIPAYST